MVSLQEWSFFHDNKNKLLVSTIIYANQLYTPHLDQHPQNCIPLLHDYEYLPCTRDFLNHTYQILEPPQVNAN